jgi:hypothetical protein
MAVSQMAAGDFLALAGARFNNLFLYCAAPAFIV